MVAIDERAHHLLLDAIGPSADIEVCCGGDSERIVREFQAIGRTARVSKSVFFGDWVKQHSQR
jgi:hypothetical protein